LAGFAEGFEGFEDFFDAVFARLGDAAEGFSDFFGRCAGGEGEECGLDGGGLFGERFWARDVGQAVPDVFGLRCRRGECQAQPDLLANGSVTRHECGA